MIEQALARVENSIEETKKKLYGVVTGRVINVLDPLALGRVQVQLPNIDALDLAPWARVAVPFAGPAHGHYFLPNINDQVLVAFENGDTNAPYVIGSLWTTMAPPPLPSPLAQTRMIRTLAGNTIMMTEAPPSIVITTPTGQTVTLSPAGVQIVSGANAVNLGPSTGPATVQVLSGSNAISLSPDGVTVTSASTLKLSAAGALTITAGGTCSITAPMVKIN